MGLTSAHEGPAVYDPGCVKTPRGINTPIILRSVVTRSASKCENSPSARHYDQIRLSFRTAKTLKRPWMCSATSYPVAQRPAYNSYRWQWSRLPLAALRHARGGL